MAATRIVVGWRSLGIAIEGDADVLSELSGHLPPFFGPQEESVETATVSVEADHLRVDLPEGLGFMGQVGPESFRAVASRIELALVSQLPDVVVLHAGVVAFNDRAVVLPGRSMAGKSTLVQALVAAGATYYSDEFALIEADGRVSAYPRRMTIRTHIGTERITLPLVADIGAEPVSIGLVALLSYAQGGLAISEITPAAALLGMVENSVNVRRAPEASLRTLSAALTFAQCISGTRGEADEVAALIRGISRTNFKFTSDMP